MDSVRQYLLSLTAAAIVCAIINSLCNKKGTSGNVIKMLCGIFMALTVVKPLVQFELTDFFSFDIISTEASAYVSEGERISITTMEDIIISKTQAYILDKAESLGGKLHVEVALKNGIPARVSLAGYISPYGKTQLVAWLIDELGIPLEAQIWT